MKQKRFYIVEIKTEKHRQHCGWGVLLSSEPPHPPTSPTLLLTDWPQMGALGALGAHWRQPVTTSRWKMSRTLKRITVHPCRRRPETGAQTQMAPGAETVRLPEEVLHDGGCGLSAAPAAPSLALPPAITAHCGVLAALDGTWWAPSASGRRGFTAARARAHTHTHAHTCTSMHFTPPLSHSSVGWWEMDGWGDRSRLPLTAWRWNGGCACWAAHALLCVSSMMKVWGWGGSF